MVHKVPKPEGAAGVWRARVVYGHKSQSTVVYLLYSPL